MDIFNILKNSGWYDGRKIDTQDFNAVFRTRDLPIFESAIKIFETYGDLHIEFASDIYLDLRHLIFSPRNFSIFMNFHEETIGIVQHFVKKPISPVALIEHNYHEPNIYMKDEVYISESGNIYVFSDDGVYDFGKFDEFIFKLHNLIDGKLIVSMSEIDTVFHDDRSYDDMVPDFGELIMRKAKNQQP